MGCIPPCSSVFRVLQARILDWLIVSFSGVLYHAMLCMLSHFSCVQLFATLWTIACQAPLSMGFSRQEYWSKLLFPPPRDLPNPEIQPASLTSPALAGRFFTTGVSGGPDGKESTCSARNLGSIPGSGRTPGRGHVNPLQYSSWAIPMERGAWQAMVHRVAKSRTMTEAI